MRMVVVWIRMALELFVFSTNYTNLHELGGQLPLAFSVRALAAHRKVPALAAPPLYRGSRQVYIQVPIQKRRFGMSTYKSITLPQRKRQYLHVFVGSVLACGYEIWKFGFLSSGQHRQSIL